MTYDQINRVIQSLKNKPDDWLERKSRDGFSHAKNNSLRIEEVKIDMPQSGGLNHYVSIHGHGWAKDFPLDSGLSKAYFAMIELKEMKIREHQTQLIEDDLKVL